MRMTGKAIATAGPTALMGLVALMGPTTAQAAPHAGGYVAALATPLSAPRQQIVDGTLWKCTDAQCAAPAKGARAVLVCQRIVRTFGPVSRFSTPAGDLSGEDLTRCNDQN